MDASVNSSDPIDRASLEADRDFALRMRDRESKLIRKIKNALVRIEEGTFGICEMCGEPIAVKRLKARPVTTHCIDCKRVMETLERLVGD
jgi:DnaK suppressor protein